MPIRDRVHQEEQPMWQEVSERLTEYPEFQEAVEDLVRARNGYIRAIFRFLALRPE